MSATNNGNSNGDLFQYPDHNLLTAQQDREKSWVNSDNPYDSERDAVMILRLQGIYADYGRWTRWKYTDVVAWGCVRIETKTARVKYHSGNQVFQWRVSPSHHPERGLRGEIFMMIADYGDKVETALFPVDHPIFYKPDGSLKKGIHYRPDKVTSTWHESRYGVSLNAGIWREHLNNFDLIEQVKERNKELIPLMTDL